MRKLTATALMTVLLASVPAASALAAQAQQQPQAAPQQAQAVDVSDKQLQQFADAQEAVNNIREDAVAKLEQIKDKNEAQQLQQQANQDMISAVKNSGLSVQNYNVIARAVHTNTKLQARLKQLSNS